MIVVHARWPEEAKEGSKRSFDVNGATQCVWGQGEDGVSADGHR